MHQGNHPAQSYGQTLSNGLRTTPLYVDYRHWKGSKTLILPKLLVGNLDNWAVGVWNDDALVRRGTSWGGVRDPARGNPHFHAFDTKHSGMECLRMPETISDLYTWIQTNCHDYDTVMPFTPLIRDVMEAVPDINFVVMFASGGLKVVHLYISVFN